MRASNPLTLAEIKTHCPAAFHNAPKPGRSERYVHLPTSQLITRMMDNGYGVSRAQQKHTRAEEDMATTRHLLAFRPLDTFSQPVIAGAATPEVLLVSSHDGTTAFGLFVGMFVFVCANGLMAGENFFSEKIQHRGDAADKLVVKSDEVIEHFVPKLNTWCKDAQSTIMSPFEIGEFCGKAMKIRHGADEPYSPLELANHRRPEDDGSSVWQVYNRVQENLMQGGVEGKTASGRRSVLRPINRVTKDVTYNQKLWDLAGSYLEAA